MKSHTTFALNQQKKTTARKQSINILHHSSRLHCKLHGKNDYFLHLQNGMPWAPGGVMDAMLPYVAF